LTGLFSCSALKIEPRNCGRYVQVVVISSFTFSA
jgi:hypothetical protein